MIEQHVWNMDLNNNPNLVEEYISKLRAKLDQGDLSYLTYPISPKQV
jgi:DNA-binding response OmpR family regulator